jgi:hypothetical protein
MGKLAHAKASFVEGVSLVRWGRLGDCVSGSIFGGNQHADESRLRKNSHQFLGYFFRQMSSPMNSLSSGKLPQSYFVPTMETL